MYSLRFILNGGGGEALDIAKTLKVLPLEQRRFFFFFLLLRLAGAAAASRLRATPPPPVLLEQRSLPQNEDTGRRWRWRALKVGDCSCRDEGILGIKDLLEAVEWRTEENGRGKIDRKPQTQSRVGVRN